MGILYELLWLDLLPIEKPLFFVGSSSVSLDPLWSNSCNQSLWFHYQIPFYDMRGSHMITRNQQIKPITIV